MKGWDPYKGVRFHPISNDDGTFHVLLIDDNGGYIFADKMSQEDAEFAAITLNAEANK